MSKSIALTQYAEDGSQVFVIVATGEVTTDPEGNEVPITETFSFGAMPVFTDATMAKKFSVKDYVAQCEREVTGIISGPPAAKMIEVQK